LCLIKSRSSAG